MDDWIDLLLLILMLYVFVAMKNMYAQGWFRTFFKYLFLAWGYFIFVVIGLVLNLLVSALLVEFLPAIPAGLARKEFQSRLEAAIETTSMGLLAEGRVTVQK